MVTNLHAKCEIAVLNHRGDRMLLPPLLYGKNSAEAVIGGAERTQRMTLPIKMDKIRHAPPV